MNRRVLPVGDPKGGNRVVSLGGIRWALDVRALVFLHPRTTQGKFSGARESGGATTLAYGRGCLGPDTTVKSHREHPPVRAEVEGRGNGRRWPWSSPWDGARASSVVRTAMTVEATAAQNG
jgi:hypothetical protein